MPQAPPAVEEVELVAAQVLAPARVVVGVPVAAHVLARVVVAAAAVRDLEVLEALRRQLRAQ